MDEEQIKEQQKELRRTGRDLEKIKRDLEKQEQELILNIKKAAKENNKQICNILTKDLVRVRNQKARCCKANSQIGAISSQSKIIQANQKLSGAMKKTTTTMNKINDQSKPLDTMRILEEFSKQNQMLNMKEDLINESLAAALEDSEDEAQEQEIMNKVLDEIGIEISGKMVKTPSSNKEIKTNNKLEIDDYVEQELAKLKM